MKKIDFNTMIMTPLIMKFKRKVIDSPEYFDILTAVWILSNNDDNPIMLYDSLNKRLSIPSTIDLKKMVLSRRELFRPGVKKSELEKKKINWKSNHNIPEYLLEFSDEQRKKIINEITEADVFRSQFRIGEKTDKTSIETINWGLNHIEKIRQYRIEKQNESLQRISSKWVPILSLVITLFTISSTMFLQNASINNQRVLKKLEIKNMNIIEQYKNIISAMTDLKYDLMKNNHNNEDLVIVNFEKAYKNMLPYMDSTSINSFMQNCRHFLSHYQECKLIESNPSSKYQKIKEINTLSMVQEDIESLLVNTLYLNSTIK